MAFVHCITVLATVRRRGQQGTGYAQLKILQDIVQRQAQ